MFRFDRGPKDHGHFYPGILKDQGVDRILSGGMGCGALDLLHVKNFEVLLDTRGDASTASEAWIRWELTGSLCHVHMDQGQCEGTCEIAPAAVLAARAVCPANTGASQIACAKESPIDYSHFCINGRFNRLKMTLPLLTPALIRMNREDCFTGAVMTGISCIVGEDARNKDPVLRIEGRKVVHFSAHSNRLF